MNVWEFRGNNLIKCFQLRSVEDDLIIITRHKYVY